MGILDRFSRKPKSTEEIRAQAEKDLARQEAKQEQTNRAAETLAGKLKAVGRFQEWHDREVPLSAACSKLELELRDMFMRELMKGTH